MATIAQVRSAAHNATADIPRLNRYEFPQDSVEVPAAIVAGIEFTRSTFDGGRTVNGAVLVLVSHSDGSQLLLLDELLNPTGAQSVVAALEAVSDADGVSLSWDNVGGYGEVEWGGVAYYGATVSFTAFT